MNVTFIKGYCKILVASLIMIGAILPFAIFIHESTHVLTYSLEGFTIVSFHVLDQASFNHGALGHVDVIGITAIGHPIHEFVAYTAELTAGLAFFLFLLFIVFKKFTKRQLIAMGVYAAGGEEREKTRGKEKWKPSVNNVERR